MHANRSTEPQTSALSAAPDRIILVYDGDSGVRALLIDIVKKAIGREDCALCEVTYGPCGKREAWRQCEARLNAKVDEMHRDQLPEAWAVSRANLPCILGRFGDEIPFVLLTKDEINACRSRPEALEAGIRAALAVNRGRS